MSEISSNRSCPLCSKTDISKYVSDNHRDYFKCQNCALIFVPGDQLLNPTLEKQRYESHQNSPADKGYVKFLSQLLNPMCELLAENLMGLDFGSGPGPTISGMFEKQGHTMDIYDPFFAPDKSVLNKTYDFITMTEVAEHLYNPIVEFELLWKMLKSGGLLGLMTTFNPPAPDQFKNWHYRNDDTHVSFFSKKTFEYIGTLWQTNPTFINNNVILFKKN